MIWTMHSPITFKLKVAFSSPREFLALHSHFPSSIFPMSLISRDPSLGLILNLLPSVIWDKVESMNQEEKWSILSFLPCRDEWSSIKTVCALITASFLVTKNRKFRIYRKPFVTRWILIPYHSLWPWNRLNIAFSSLPGHHCVSMKWWVWDHQLLDIWMQWCSLIGRLCPMVARQSSVPLVRKKNVVSHWRQKYFWKNGITYENT